MVFEQLSGSHFVFLLRSYQDGLPRRGLLAMTVGIMRHCERSVAVHAFLKISVFELLPVVEASLLKISLWPRCYGKFRNLMYSAIHFGFELSWRLAGVIFEQP